VVDALESQGGQAHIADLAETLGQKRPRDLRRRQVARLEERGIVEVDGDEVTLVQDWLDALDAEREASGEIAARRRDMRAYNASSRAWQERLRIKAERAPTEAEMREQRESRPDRRRAQIARAIADLFAAKPEFRGRRVGQITCALYDYLPPPPIFPRGAEGAPKDHEVQEILDGRAA